MILCLLLSLKSSFGQTNDTLPLRGRGYVINDTTFVLIPIDNIKDATLKLIEREELLEINKAKDSLILSYKDLVTADEAQIDKLNYEISNLNTTINDNIELNRKLSKSFKTQKVLKDVFIGTTCIGVAASLILFLQK